MEFLTFDACFAPCVGGIAGFLYFLMSLEDEDMGKIIWRKNKFTCVNIINYIKQPFISLLFWKHPEMWDVTSNKKPYKII